VKNIMPAQWIEKPRDIPFDHFSKYGEPCVYFRKDFIASNKKVLKATLFASSIGVFKAYINGVPVDDDYMSPGWTDYHIRIPLIEYDVTHLIRAQNALVIVVGDGWALGHLGGCNTRGNYYQNIAAIAKLTIYFQDGSREEVVTDDSWRYAEGEIRRTDNFMGEVTDHNFTLDRAFCLYGYNGKNTQPVAAVDDCYKTSCLCDEVCPRTRVKLTLTPKLISNTQNCRIYDFRQNMVGVIRLKVKGQKGTKIIIRHAEMLNNDGSVYTANLRSAEATDTFILNGADEEEFRPLFTFHGFRYADIKIEGEAQILDICGEVMFSDLPQTGDFKCSDDLVNKLFSNILWGQRGNFLNIPTDCPQRDERLGWTGDAQIFCGSAMYNMYCKEFYKKYVQDMIDGQLGNGNLGGAVPYVPQYFCNDTQQVFGTGFAGWGDAIVIIPYTLYLMYGDKNDLKKALPYAKKYVNYMLDESDEYIRKAPYVRCLGDWLTCNAETDKDLISTLYFAYSSSLTAKMCAIAEDTEAENYSQLYLKIKNAFRKTFIKGGRLTSFTQTAYLMSYAFGMISADEARKPLKELFEKSGHKLTSGFLGIKHLLPVLCDLGMQDLAYEILCSTEYPGWLYSVVNGATTIWERWNSYTAENGFGDVGMNSFNHYSLGSCCEWFYKYCLGIVPQIDGAGFKKLLLRPFIDTNGKITNASGHYDSINGRIDIAWTVKGDKIDYYATVPKAIELTTDIPTGVNLHLKRV